MKHIWVRTYVSDAKSYDIWGGTTHYARVEAHSHALSAVRYECSRCHAAFEVDRKQRDLNAKITSAMWKSTGIVECDMELAKAVMEG